MASRNGSSSRNGKSSSRKTSSRGEFEDYSIVDPAKIPDGPDVLVDVPVVKVDSIDIEVDDLCAQVSLNAEVRDLVELSVGAEATLGKVELKIEGVEAQALLTARLDNVRAILARVLTSLDRNPELLESVGRAVQDVGGGAGQMLSETGQAVQQVGEGAGQGLPQLGQGAGQAVSGVGQGVQQVGGQGGGS
jgi:hypothetical protein